MGQSSPDSDRSSQPQVASPAEQMPSAYPLETSPMSSPPLPEYQEDIPLTMPAEPYPTAYQYLAQSRNDSLIKAASPERYPYGFAPPPAPDLPAPRPRHRALRIWLIAGMVAVVIAAALGVVIVRIQVSQVKKYSASVPGPATRGVEPGRQNQTHRPHAREAGCISHREMSPTSISLAHPPLARLRIAMRSASMSPR